MEKTLTKSFKELTKWKEKKHKNYAEEEWREEGKEGDGINKGMVKINLVNFEENGCSLGLREEVSPFRGWMEGAVMNHIQDGLLLFASKSMASFSGIFNSVELNQVKNSFCSKNENGNQKLRSRKLKKKKIEKIEFSKFLFLTIFLVTMPRKSLCTLPDCSGSDNALMYEGSVLKCLPQDDCASLFQGTVIDLSNSANTIYNFCSTHSTCISKEGLLSEFVWDQVAAECIPIEGCDYSDGSFCYESGCPETAHIYDSSTKLCSPCPEPTPYFYRYNCYEICPAESAFGMSDLILGSMCKDRYSCENLGGFSPVYGKNDDNKSIGLCLTEEQCKSDSRFKYHVTGEVCILASLCDTDGTDAGTCDSGCHGADPIKKGATCTNVEACIAEGMYYKKSEQSCVTESECKSGTDPRMFIDTNLNQCLLESECSPAAVKGIQTCTVECSNDEFRLLYKGIDKYECVDSDTCSSYLGDTSSIVAHTPMSLSSGEKYCYTDEECTDSPLTLFKQSPGTCLEKDLCDLSFEYNGLCVDSCSAYQRPVTGGMALCLDEPSCSDFKITVSTVNYCADQSECKLIQGALYKPARTNPVEPAACILEADCSDTVFQKECISSTCGVDLFLLGGDSCIDSAACQATVDGDGVGYDPATVDGFRKCFSKAECVGDLIWIDTVAQGDQHCIKKTDCTFAAGLFLIDLGDGAYECKSQCDYNLSLDGQTCSTDEVCTGAGNRLLEDSGTKYCVTSTECTNRDGVVLHPESATECIIADDCKIISGYAYLDHDTPSSQECLTHTACRAKSDHALLISTDTPTQDECLTDVACKAKTLYFYDPDEGDCIRENECTKYILEKECVSTCPLYSNPEENKCMTQAECQAQDTEKTYLFIENSTPKYCLTETECRDYVIPPSTRRILTGSPPVKKFSIDGDADTATCIMKGSCDLSQKFYVAEINTCVTNCDYFLTYTATLDVAGGSSCVTQTECITLGSTPVPATIDGRADMCISKTDCKTAVGILIDYLYDVEDEKCIERTFCTGGDKFPFVGTQECLESCTYYVNLNEDGTDGSCVTEAECIAQTGDTYMIAPVIQIDADTTKKYCVTRDQCESDDGNLSLYYFDLVTDTCVTDCAPKTLIVDLNQCATNCDSNYLKENLCYSEAGCLDLGFYTSTGTPQKCLTMEQCALETTGPPSNDPFVFDLDNLECIPRTDCLDNRYLIDFKQCTDSCPYYLTFSESLTAVDSDCKRASQCLATNDLYTFDSIIDGDVEITPKFCLNEAECKRSDFNLDNFVWDVELAACILKTDCDTSQKYLLEASQLCTVTCTGYLFTPEGASRPECITAAECTAKSTSEVSYYTTPAKTVASGSESYCYTEEQCKAESTFIFQLAPQGCILYTDCSDPRLEIQGLRSCADNCNDYYLDTDTEACYSEESCRSLLISSIKHYPSPPVAASTQKLCSTKAECIATVDRVLDFDSSTCILRSDCAFPRFFINDLTECHTKCPHNLNAEGNKCFTDAECQAKTDFEIVIGEDQTFCLSQAECESSALSEFVYDSSIVGGNKCITTEDCTTASKFPVQSTGRCEDTCDGYVTPVDQICYTEDECKALTDKDGDPYITLVDNNGARMCYSKYECGNLALYLFNYDSKQCELATGCSGFVVNQFGFCSSDCSEWLLDESQSNCYTEEECAGLGSQSDVDDHFKFVKENAQGLCLTQAECKLKDSYIFDYDNQVCILQSDCTGGRFYLEDLTECRTDCEFYFGDQQFACYTDNGCTAKAGEGYRVAVNGLDKWCLTIDECKSTTKPEFVFDSGDDTCITVDACVAKAGSFAYQDPDTCTSGCPNYLTGDEKICYTEQQCLSAGASGEFQTYQKAGMTNKYCFNEASCRAKEGYLYNASPNQGVCVAEGDCSDYRITGEGECNVSCLDYYLSTDDQCSNSADCLAKGDNYLSFKITGEDQGLCMTIEECKADPTLLYDMDANTCIRQHQCDTIGGRFKVAGDGVCVSACTGDFFLDKDGENCYTKEECQSNDMLPTIVGDASNRCLTREECLVSDIDTFYIRRDTEMTCVTKPVCNSGNWVASGRECVQACPITASGARMVINDGVCQVRCDEGQFAQIGTLECQTGSSSDVCGEFSQQLNINGQTKTMTLQLEGDQATTVCYVNLESGIPGPNLAGEVEEGDYKISRDASGNVVVKPKIDPRKATKPSLESIREKLIQKGMTEPVMLRLFVYDSVPELSPEDKRRGITSIVIKPRGARILQEGEQRLEGDDVQTETDQETGETYAAFNSPGGQEFDATINFNANAEFNMIKNGLDTLFRIGIDRIDYVIPASEGTRPRPPANSEPTGVLSYFSLVFDVYIRVISPFVPVVINSYFAIQGFLSQNFQRLVIISYFNYGMRQHNDWLYVKTFKDWFADVSKIFVGQVVIDREIDYHCFEGNMRLCTFDMTSDMLTMGTFGLIIILFFGMLGYLGALIIKEKLDKEKRDRKKEAEIDMKLKSSGKKKKSSKKDKKRKDKKKRSKRDKKKSRESSRRKRINKKRDKEAAERDYSFGEYAAYRVYPCAVLGFQTLFVFYLMSSIVNNNQAMEIFLASRYICIIIAVVLLGKLVVMCIPGTKLNKFAGRVLEKGLSKLFDKKKPRNVKIFLLFGLLYDVTLSMVVSLAPEGKLVQVPVFLVLEILFLAVTFVFNPFVEPTIFNLFLARRGLFIFQAFWMIIAAAIGKYNGFGKFLEMFIFLISCFHVLLSLYKIYVSYNLGKTEKERRAAYILEEEKIKEEAEKKKPYHVAADDEEEVFAVKNAMTMKKNTKKVNVNNLSQKTGGNKILKIESGINSDVGSDNESDNEA